jgi:multiple sugar transport system substrate-binding protein
MSNHTWRFFTILGALSLSVLTACAAHQEPAHSAIEMWPTITVPTVTQDTFLPVEPTATTKRAPTAAPTKAHLAEPTKDLQLAKATEHPLSNTDPRGQTIRFWHPWGKGTYGKTITKIVEHFNVSNEWGITVLAQDQGSYTDLEYALNHAVLTGDLPNLAVAYGNVLADWWIQGIVADINSFVEHPIFGLPPDEQVDFFQAAFNSSNYEGARLGLPFSQSGNVIFYNSTWAQELGFPDPPATMGEFKRQACAAANANIADIDPGNDGTGGFVIYSSSANILSWVYASGGEVYNASESSFKFNDDTSKKVASFLKGLWDSGCAYQTKTYANPEFATRRALFTTSSTVGCQYQEAAFKEEGAYKDEWTLLAFPGLQQGKAIIIFPQLIGMVDTTPEQNLASWLFMKYLASPSTQAEWTITSQYYPTRISAIDLIGDFRDKNPQWAAGIDLLAYGYTEPVHPAWRSIRMYLQTTFDEVLNSPIDQISTLLEDLDRVAEESKAEFNK